MSVLLLWYNKGFTISIEFYAIIFYFARVSDKFGHKLCICSAATEKFSLQIVGLPQVHIDEDNDFMTK